MADNYLEKRMEELRSGRLARDAKRPSVRPRKGHLSIPFPARRVLIISPADAMPGALIDAFLKADCRVALFSPDAEAGSRLAHDRAVRFYRLDTSDLSAVTEGASDLIYTWKDLDIIVSPAPPAGAIAETWTAHRTRLPIATDYGGRLIIIADYTPGDALDSMVDTLARQCAPLRISVNAIALRHAATAPSIRTATPADIARTALLLALPDSDFITARILPIDIRL